MVIACSGSYVLGQTAKYIRNDSNATMPEHFIVHFVNSCYTLADHSQFLGRNASAAKDFLQMNWLPGYAAFMNDTTLEDVLEDPVRPVNLIHRDDALTLTGRQTC